MDRQTNGQLWDAMLVSATDDALAHARSWTDLLDKHARSLPEDRPPSGHDGDDGRSDRSYAEHELKAMRRELAALAAVRFMQVATNLGTTYRLAETTSEARWHATDSPPSTRWAGPHAISPVSLAARRTRRRTGCPAERMCRRKSRHG